MAQQKKTSDNEIKQVQGDVLAMRSNAPSYVNRQLNAYKDAIQADLKSTTYTVNNKQTINLKNLHKVNVSQALNDSRAKHPQDLMAKQIQLNSRTDNLMKALEYVKK